MKDSTTNKKSLLTNYFNFFAIFLQYFNIDLDLIVNLSRSINSKESHALKELYNNTWSLVEDKLQMPKYTTGRKPYSLKDIFSIRFVLLFFGLSTIKDTLRFLKNSPTVCYIIGLRKVPSESVVCQKSKLLSERIDFKEIHDKITKIYFKDRLITNLSIDSTIIDAREKATITPKKLKKKVGRKEIGSIEKFNYLSENKLKLKSEYECIYGDYKRYVRTLTHSCSCTAKRNSKGNKTYYQGFKIHLAVDDYGIVVSFFTTGAKVHDSKLAIPLIRNSAEKTSFLYALMDGGYSSKKIVEATKRLGSVPIIDFKANRNGEKIEMEEFEKDRYKYRSTVERANSELKGKFLPKKLYSRNKNAIFDMGLAVLLFTLKRMKDQAKSEGRILNF